MIGAPGLYRYTQEKPEQRRRLPPSPTLHVSVNEKE